MKTHSAHPARSPEFLSRLHDGELTPAERAQFEAHRAHCAECRRAAAEFEEALSLYRSSSPTPASPDLAARILRKLQAANRRRDPFGVVFGIDLKWAGAFAAALVAMIIGSSVVLRQQERSAEAPSATPIPVRLKSSARQEPLQKSAGHAAPPAPAGPAETKAKANEKREALPGYAPEPEPAREEEAASRDLDAVALEEPAAEPPPKPAAADKKEALARARPTAPERAGGEGSVPAAPSALASASGTVLRLKVTALDSQGEAPERLGTPPDLPPEERGRAYELFVDAGGRVFDVKPYSERRKARPERQDAARDVLEPAPPEALKSLRFRPGDRPRKLLVRIQ